MDKQEFIELYAFDYNYNDIAKIRKENGLAQSDTDLLLKETEDEREIIKKIKGKYSLIEKKDTENGTKELQFESSKVMYKWYKNQDRKCYYCGTEEWVVADLFENKILDTKRSRGKSLEIERKNSISNDYSIENCVLACHICNNTKSDFITENDFKKHFAPLIKKFLSEKYAEFLLTKAT